MKKTVNALGDICPIPLVKAKEAIKELQGAGTVEVLVDNEIAVQNLTKMANQKGYGCVSQKLKEQEYQVTLTVGEAEATEEAPVEEENYVACAPAKKNRLVVISSKTMGEGNGELGATLLKGFIYALTQQDELPDQRKQRVREYIEPDDSGPFYSSRLGTDHIILTQLIKNCGTHLTGVFGGHRDRQCQCRKEQTLKVSRRTDYRKNLEIDTKRHH